MSDGTEWPSLIYLDRRPGVPPLYEQFIGFTAEMKGLRPFVPAGLLQQMNETNAMLRKENEDMKKSILSLSMQKEALQRERNEIKRRIDEARKYARFVQSDLDSLTGVIDP